MKRRLDTEIQTHRRGDREEKATKELRRLKMNRGNQRRGDKVGEGKRLEEVRKQTRSERKEEKVRE